MCRQIEFKNGCAFSSIWVHLLLVSLNILVLTLHFAFYILPYTLQAAEGTTAASGEPDDSWLYGGGTAPAPGDAVRRRLLNPKPQMSYIAHCLTQASDAIRCRLPNPKPQMPHVAHGGLMGCRTVAALPSGNNYRMMPTERGDVRYPKPCTLIGRMGVW
jgi:hypothetical protein